MDTLAASTKAIASGSTGNDSTYTAIENQIAALTAVWDVLAAQMKPVLDGAAFHHTGFAGNAVKENQLKTLIQQAGNLLNQSDQLSH